ncbi:DGQHR domain-containing protein DpdB [Moritella sp. Urea-trap-13]|uniref:DGQHR domain-containing protein DpdB n=1 Tax=Moritella sp. Urea-trap-13 TaxID=2058327 RepID=UPI000C34A036|nr:DGQHR domain-containing protein DpdB [Moritella sp. Urea-trap-13]PKH08201.1 hypothetical protein CXF93_05880 [Moritella sp. Urea-trap-13]
MKIIRLPAIKIQQSEDRQLFSISIEGKLIDKVCDISRIKRNTLNHIIGYQRPEVIKHISGIKKYIESPNSMIPNSIVIAFNSSVYFKELENNKNIGYLNIPFNSDSQDWVKPGLIVDGQQRTAALRDADSDYFEMPASVFITDSAEEQREQFMLVNSTKPLSKSLLYELAPYTKGLLPPDLRRKKFPSLLTQHLNNNEESPLSGMIKTITNPDGIVADNSMIKMLDNSLREGALYVYRDPETGTARPDEFNSMISILYDFWASVKIVFSDDWGKKPRYSRLLHGAGIAGTGQLFDEMYYDYIIKNQEVTLKDYFIQKLEYLAPHCHWSSGVWDFGVDIDGHRILRKWNDIQNLPKDIKLLSDHLLKLYNSLDNASNLNSSIFNSRLNTVHKRL